MSEPEETLLQNKNADLFPDEATPVSLVDGLKAGNEDSWTRFVSIFGPMVYKMLRNRGVSEVDASELGQQVFVKVHRGIGNFSWDGSGQRIRFWLPPIIRNVVIDAARAKKKELQALGGSEFRQVTQQVAESAESLSKLENEKFELTPSDFEVAFKQGLETLKKRFKPHVWQCFYEKHANDLSGPEIAESLGLNENQVRQAIHRVKAAFLQQFDGLIENPELP